MTRPARTANASPLALALQRWKLTPERQVWAEALGLGVGTLRIWLASYADPQGPRPRNTRGEPKASLARVLAMDLPPDVRAALEDMGGTRSAP